jgi:tripartite-type tricarboxylate transporter receptor subunit TctC
MLARVFAQKLTEDFGHQFIVDNRPGATGTIATAQVAKSPPDGYTILMHATSSLVSAYLYRNVGYDPLKDFAPIASVGKMPFYLVVHPSVPATTVKEIIALARRRPNDLAYASPGAGSGGHLVMETFMRAAGALKLVHVPYKGAAPGVAALIAGEVSLAFDTISTSQPQVDAGRLRGIAVSSGKRAAALPQIPTMIESGIPGFEMYLWFGLFAPAGTPAAAIDRLNGEINSIVKGADYQTRMRTLAAEASPNAPADFAAFLDIDVPKWVKTIKETGARAD